MSNDRGAYHSWTSEVVKQHARAIPERLKVLQGGRSQREWARQLDIPQQNLCRYLAGQRAGPHFLIHICRSEGVNLNWLMAGEGPQYRMERVVTGGDVT